MAKDELQNKRIPSCICEICEERIYNDLFEVTIHKNEEKVFWAPYCETCIVLMFPLLEKEEVKK